MLDCAHGAPSSSGVGRVLERKVAPRLPVRWPLLRWPVPHLVPGCLRLLLSPVRAGVALAVSLLRCPRRLGCAHVGLGAQYGGFRDGGHSVVLPLCEGLGHPVHTKGLPLVDAAHRRLG